ncbi:MAG TPA: hypothetical protein VNY08_03690, partial [Bradyrhizobium sp.]|nr:hypothetical protein [Bradyrhizobium sp.]
RVSLLPKRSVVACTTQIISGSKQRTTAEDAFVKQELLELAAVCEEVAKMKLTTNGQVDSRNNGPASTESAVGSSRARKD